MDSTRRRRRQGQHFVHSEALLRIEREHNVVEALACVIRFFGREEEYRWRFEAHDGRKHEIYTVFEVEYPQHYASLTVGVRNVVLGDVGLRT
ncbi:hypothetical protein [Bradyrhizobium sp. Rc2d]|uniref:hypothetical protein n=1 Tax=Bradyrhizobium sp. Rc2d TaxID=1855321 RepID=UPI000B80BC89|nr:hypothetical protein [Bradyrhizobium sp. Rc2d]